MCWSMESPKSGLEFKNTYEGQTTPKNLIHVKNLENHKKITKISKKSQKSRKSLKKSQKSPKNLGKSQRSLKNLKYQNIIKIT